MSQKSKKFREEMKIVENAVKKNVWPPEISEWIREWAIQKKTSPTAAALSLIMQLVILSYELGDVV